MYLRLRWLEEQNAEKNVVTTFPPHARGRIYREILRRISERRCNGRYRAEEIFEIFPKVVRNYGVACPVNSIRRAWRSRLLTFDFSAPGAWCFCLFVYLFVIKWVLNEKSKTGRSFEESLKSSGGSSKTHIGFRVKCEILRFYRKTGG